MASLSDGARYAWPWFWCASNTVGRVKLNYRDFVTTVFRQFKKVPTKDQFWDWASQYHECFLMFVYSNGGEVWGQWAAGERYLPKYKLKADEATPRPPASDFAAWTKLYAERKTAEISGKCRVLNNSENFQKLSKDLLIFEKTAMERRGEERRDVGKEKTTNPSPPRAVLGGFGEWWAVWWNKTAKAEAQRAWPAVERIHGKDYLVAQCIADRQRFEGTTAWDWRSRLHPATWLRGRRWEDELPPAIKPAGRQSRSDAIEEALRDL
jgi:hypothetical protein